MKIDNKCRFCGVEYKSIQSLCLHVRQKHGMESKEYYDKFFKTDTDGICEVCGKPTKFYRISQGGYFRFCSKQCSAKSELTKQRKKETNEKLNGGIGFASPRIREELKEKWKAEHGVEWYSQSDAWHNSVEEHALENYGVTSVNKCDWKIEKTKDGFREKYGVETNMQLPEFRIQTSATNIERYGDAIPSRTQQVKDKMAATNMETYGYKAPCQNPIIKESAVKKLAETWKRKQEEFYKKNFPEVVSFTSNTFTCHCNKCGNDYTIQKYLFRQRKERNIPTCLLCNPINKPYSAREKEIADYIKSVYTGMIIENDRSVLGRQELDIYIPDKKIAFEFDGVYWHNELYKAPDYHLKKTNDCESAGIHLIHVFEDEWVYRCDIVKSRIRSLLELNERLGARRCEIRDVSDVDARVFLNDNHIQGYCASKYRYGLYYNDELVALMTFGKSRFADETELLRYCSRTGLNVIGGADRLFRHFMKENPDIKEVITYADRRWSTKSDNMYTHMGFDFVSTTRNNYYYVIDDIRHNRIEFQKHKLVAAGFDPNKSEHDIMFDRDIFRVYDSGNIKFRFKRTP